MAGGVVGIRICEQLYSYKKVLDIVTLIFIATCANVPTLNAQPDLGFLSLDCGGSLASYNDSHGLLWITDEGLINTGKSFQQTYQGDQQSLGSFRYFPGDQSKYCYVLYTPSLTYLVRASFYMNQTELASREPFAFTLSMDATDWLTVTSGVTTKSELLVVEETIFYPPMWYTNFCLRSLSGVPFISSLELRPLDFYPFVTDMYSYNGRFSQMLALALRWNLGAENVPDVRYPDDRYDRIWTTPDSSTSEQFSISRSNQPPANINDSQYWVPPKVMQDAWLCNEEPITFSLANSNYFSSLSEYAFVVVYHEILNTSAPDIYLDIGFSGHYPAPWALSSPQPSMVAMPYISLSTAISLNVSFDTANLSSYIYDGNASINAIEVYFQLSYNASITNSDDASVITALTTIFSLDEWQGDPCVPVPFNWLSCNSLEATFIPGCGENCSQRSVFASAFNVTSINLSNITNANLSLIHGNSSALPLGRLQALDTLSITSSAVNDPTLLFLVNYTSPGLVTLNLSCNDIQNLPRVSDWAGIDNVAFQNLTTLDVSHNNLTGLLSSLEDQPFSTTLQNLNLSYNSLTSFPENLGNTTLNRLVTLNLSHNQFDGEISTLDELVQMNKASIQELDVSYNNLRGIFSSDLYFSIPNLISANFDQNFIGTILNLSTWYEALREAASEDAAGPASYSSMPNITKKVFSFMNNNIVDIVPSASDFDVKTQSLFKRYRAFGVMLNGNPYCIDIRSPVQQYLCRSSLSDTFPDDTKSNNSTTILTFSILGGAFALLLLCITSATVWKLRKQLYNLRSIQQALAERKVQPPFYHYSDLKIATQNFHKNNKLGHGAFGIVYKGVLTDETLAVKKLFESQETQVIDEFLNEVVLITGIKHRNLVQLKGCCVKDKQRILVYEYAEKGNLAEALWGSEGDGSLNWKQRLNICVGVARGLSYLHEELQPSIIHRDIKPPNILLDNNFNPKIADFGLARHVLKETSQPHYTHVAGTLGYFAPEYAMQGRVSEKTDVYSYGILILEIVTGRQCIDYTRPPEETFLKDWVATMRKKSLLFDILQPELRGDCDIAEVMRVINIALLCVQHHPEKRPKMSQIVTMFSGSMDVEVLADEFVNIYPTVARDAQHPSLDVIEEEPVRPLLDLDSPFTFDISSSRSNSRAFIELKALSGR